MSRLLLALGESVTKLICCLARSFGSSCRREEHVVCSYDGEFQRDLPGIVSSWTITLCVPAMKPFRFRFHIFLAVYIFNFCLVDLSGYSVFNEPIFIFVVLFSGVRESPFFTASSFRILKEETREKRE